MTFIPLDYKNEDIRRQTKDLIDNLQSTSPSGGVNIIAQEVTPNMERVSNAEFDLLTDFRSISISNVGAANGTVLGAQLQPGETVTFAAQLNNYFSGFTADATGTEFLIIYIE